MTDRFLEPITPHTHILFEGQLIHEERSKYQHIQVYRHEYYGHILVLDGLLQTTTADEFIYHEMLAHVPLCSLPREPRRVLIVGGGDGGALAQVLRHPTVEEVVVVDLDEAVPRVSRRFFPFAASFDDPRVRLVIDDGARFVKSPEARRAFDCAIVDSSDPDTPASVLYRTAFYSDLKECLAPDSVIIHQVGTPEFMQKELADTFAAVSAVFDRASVCHAAIFTYGGSEAFVLGSSFDPSVPRRVMRGKWYNPEVHSASFALPEFWKDIIGA